jgi:predicted kinase
MDKYLIYTCGYPFSGKSTLARTIADETGFSVVAVDDKSSGNTNSSWLRAYLSAYAALFRCFERGESVVFDSVAHTRKSRKRLAKHADTYDARFIGIWLDVDPMLADRRRLENLSRPVRPDVPHDDFKTIVDTFELPDPDETMLTYSPHISPTSWVNQILLPALTSRGYA